MGRLDEKRIWRIACFGLLILGLAMVGCYDARDDEARNDEAQAQTEWRVVTFSIEPGSIVFRSATTKPTIEVADGTTTYTVKPGGAVIEYTLIGTGNAFIPTSPRTLIAGDQVIDRPGMNAGILTLIRLI
jgi:hypothetical protein